MKFKDFFLKEQQQAIIVLYPGGFKPPHKGHFEALKYLIQKSGANLAKVFVGKLEREGINQDKSIKIWNVYKKYISIPIEIVPALGVDKRGRPASPLSMVYDFIEDNKNNFGKFIVGAGEEDLKRFEGLKLDKQRYPNTVIIGIPPQFNRISGTETRKKIFGRDKNQLDFIPNEVKDIDSIKKILGL